MKYVQGRPRVAAGRRMPRDPTPREWQDHLERRQYGDFLLTDAIRPQPAGGVLPGHGYRHDRYRDGERGRPIPVLAASVSRERLLETFFALLDPLGSLVDVALDVSPDEQDAEESKASFWRNEIDLPVLKSILSDYEDLLLNDGYLGVAVVAQRRLPEVSFDEHKLLFVYGSTLDPFEAILRDLGVPGREDLALISEGAHIHLRRQGSEDQVEQLKNRLAVDA